MLPNYPSQRTFETILPLLYLCVSTLSFRANVFFKKKKKVVLYKAKVPQAFSGSGMSLGGGGSGDGASAGGAPVSAEDARAKRLARFGNMVSTEDGAKPDPEVAK